MWSATKPFQLSKVTGDPTFSFEYPVRETESVGAIVYVCGG